MTAHLWGFDLCLATTNLENKCRTCFRGFDCSLMDTSPENEHGCSFLGFSGIQQHSPTTTSYPVPVTHHRVPYPCPSLVPPHQHHVVSKHETAGLTAITTISPTHRRRMPPPHHLLSSQNAHDGVYPPSKHRHVHRHLSNT